MQRTPKYPLTALRELRDRNVEAATAELGTAVRAREAAGDAKRAARRHREEAEARAAAVTQSEEERLGRGELRAVDLARAEAWGHGARAELSTLVEAVDSADADLEATGKAEVAARAVLAQRTAELGAVAKNQARFDDERRRARDGAAEDEAEEAHAARASAQAERG